jgi:hypothetical protein
MTDLKCEACGAASSLLTVTEEASLTGRCERTVQRQMKRGELQSVLVGSRRIIVRPQRTSVGDTAH